MANETLGEILSGQLDQRKRAYLHTMLDEMLDAADAHDGRLDPPAFWLMVAELARGRGIAEELEWLAAVLIANHAGRTLDLSRNPIDGWRVWQWAFLSALLANMSALPGRVLPREFSAVAFRAVAENSMRGSKESELPDLMGLGTQRGSEWEGGLRTIRGLLVLTVYYRAEQRGKTVKAVREPMLPDLPYRTWQDWQRELSQTMRKPVTDIGDGARAAARGEADPTPYRMDDHAVGRLMQLAYRPNR